MSRTYELIVRNTFTVATLLCTCVLNARTRSWTHRSLSDIVLLSAFYYHRRSLRYSASSNLLQNEVAFSIPIYNTNISVEMYGRDWCFLCVVQGSKSMSYTKVTLAKATVPLHKFTVYVSSEYIKYIMYNNILYIYHNCVHYVINYPYIACILLYYIR